MSDAFDRENLISFFVGEALDGTATMSRALNPSDHTFPMTQQIQEHYVTAHRIPGAAALYGYGGVAVLCEKLEVMCERATQIPDGCWPMAVGVMRETVEKVQTLVNAIASGKGEDQATVDQCLALSKKWVSGAITLETLAPPISDSSDPVKEPVHHMNSESPDPQRPVEYVLPPMDAEVLSKFLPQAEEYLAAIDGLILVFQRKRDDAYAAHRFVRAACALKQSACTAGFQIVGDLAHPMEACMIAVREGHVVLTDELLHLLAQGAALIRTLRRRDFSTVVQLQRDVPKVLSLLTGLSGGQIPASPADFPAEPGTHQKSAASRTSVEHESAHALSLPDEYFLPQLDQEVLSYFVPEAQEYLEALETDILQLDAFPESKTLIQQLFRTAHTLKGSAYTVGFQVIGDLVHHVEDFMGAVRDQRLRILPGHTDAILRAIDVVRVLMQNDSNAIPVARKQFQDSLMELKRMELGAEPDVSATSGSARTRVLQTASQTGLGEESATGNKHPEGRVGDERDVIRVSRARLEQLMELVDELVIGGGRLEQHLMDLERLSEQVMARKSRLVEALDSLAGTRPIVVRGASPDQSTSSDIRSCGFENFSTSDFGTCDDFNVLAHRIGDVSADITKSMVQLNGSVRHAHADMKQMQHVARNLQDEIARARMIPIGTPFTRFRRAIRDLARGSNKEVALVTSGEHTKVDTGVVERLVDPLVHLVRNAVYHGIELPTVRIAKGKQAAGTIYLHAAHQGNSIQVEVEDDGAGLDMEKIRRKAIAAGLAKPEQVGKMTDAEVLQFIFAPGFSTADAVSDQAGRGVGLDVVKKVVEGMNGRIEVESLPDVGTKFTLHLPLTLLMTSALFVRAGSERYAIALSSIREVALAANASLRKADNHTLLSLGEDIIEVHALRHLLGGESSDINGAMSIVIVRTATGVMGLAVDELVGRHEIDMKSLGGLRSFEESYFGGATIDPQGRVILVIDPRRLGSRTVGPPSVRDTGLETMSQTRTNNATGPVKAVEASHGKKVCIH